MADQIDVGELQQAVAQFTSSLNRLGGSAQNVSTVMTQSGSQFGGSVRNVGQGMARLRMELDRGRVGFTEAGRALRVMQDRFDELDAAQRSSIQGQRIAADQQRMAGELLRRGAGEISADLAKSGVGAAIEYFKGQITTSISSIQQNVGGMQMAFNLQNRELESQISLLQKLSAGAAAASAALATIPGWQSKMAAGALAGAAALGEAATAAAKLEAEGLIILQTELAKTNAGFKVMTAAGALFADGMTDIRKGAADAGLDLGDFAKITASNTDALAKLGGSVTQGVKRFSDVNRYMGEYRTGLQNLGISTDQQAEGTIEYMGILQRSGQLESKSSADIARGTADYLTNLRAVSAFTGEDAKKAAARAKDASAQLMVQKKLNEMGAGAAERFQAGIRTAPEFLQKAMQQSLAGDGVITDPEVQQALEAVPAARELMERTMANIRDSSLTQEQVSARYQEDLKALGPAMKDQALEAGNSVGAANLFGGSLSGLTKIIEGFADQGNKGAAALKQQAEGTTEITTKLKTTTDVLTSEVSKAATAFSNATEMLNRGITPILKNYTGRGIGPTQTGLEQTVNEGTARTKTALEAVSGIEVLLRRNEPPRNEQVPNRANGGINQAQPGGTLIRVAEAGLNEASVPLPDGKTIPVTLSDNMLTTKQFNEQFATVMANNNQPKQQIVAPAAPTGQEIASGVASAFETVLKGPAGFATALEEVKNQLANDSRQQMTAMQQQIDRMDTLVTAMQDNAEYSRRIANEMA
jgi:hypothetical protein